MKMFEAGLKKEQMYTKHSSQTIHLWLFHTKPVLFLLGLENEKLEVLPVLDLKVEHVCSKRMLQLLMMGSY